MQNKALIYMLIFSLFRAVDILLGRWVYAQGVDPIAWIVVVYIFSLSFWGVYMWSTKTFQSVSDLKKAPGAYAIVSITAALAVAAAYTGLSMTQAVNYSFLIQMSAVFTIIYAHIRFSDEKITTHVFLLMCAFMLGVYLVATDGKNLQLHIGDIYVLIAAALFGINNISIKSCLQKNIGVPMIIFGRNVATLLMGILLSFIGGSILLPSIRWGYAALSAGLVLVWLSALNNVVKYSSPSYMVMMSMINPVVVLIGALFFLHESFSLIQITGGAIIIVSGIVLEWSRRKK